eukprot:1379000-Karenia_brevis.AAC.1
MKSEGSGYDTVLEQNSRDAEIAPGRTVDMRQSSPSDYVEWTPAIVVPTAALEEQEKMLTERMHGLGVLHASLSYPRSSSRVASCLRCQRRLRHRAPLCYECQRVCYNYFVNRSSPPTYVSDALRSSGSDA